MSKLSMTSLAVACVAAVSGQALATPTTIYGSGSTNGINAGFGDAVGQNSNLAISSDLAGNLDWVLTCGGGNLDGANAVVIYIDTDNGATGYGGTQSFTDTGGGGDELRKAISATNGGERADITFASGFNANYAIAFNSGFGALWQLSDDVGGHPYIETVSGAGFGSGGPYNMATSMASLGLAAGDSFRYILTYLDPNGCYRSNEFHGVADSSVPDFNIGFDDIVLSSGDFITFHSVPAPASLALIGAAGLVSRRRRA